MSLPQMHPLGYESKTANLPSGHHYRYADISPPPGTKTIATALLLHGFPDSAYGWRNQVKGWSSRGIRLIVPDSIGYAGSSQPLNPEEYSFKSQSDDLEALVRIAGVPENEQVVVIGHDWGAVTGTRLSQFKPNLVKGVINLCVPFSVPPQQYISLEELVAMLPNFQYQLFFAAEDSATLIDANLEKFIHSVYVTPEQYASGEAPPFEKAGVFEAFLKDDTKSLTSAILSKEEFDTMITEIRGGLGFAAMLNYYRTNRINFELEGDLPQEYRPEMPKLLIIPIADPALPLSMFADSEKNFKAIEVVKLEGICGHWVQLEKPGEVEKIIGEWVERRASKGWLA
ncbi:alpha/beta-hydrolase [Ceratobasidium sp. AG-I]|nr:alpha/beta-hydrolase [Ceratobasidium sp. AG-I]